MSATLPDVRPGAASADAAPGRARLRLRWLAAGVAAVVVAATAGLTLGPVRLNPVHVLGELVGWHTLGPREAAIVTELRLPRVVLGLLVGAMLALAGGCYQGIFRNPLADPYLLGAAARSPATLILAGVAVSTFLAAGQTYLQQRHSDTIREVYSWLLGRLATAGWHDVLLVLPYAVVTATAIIAHRRTLDVLSVGDDEAASLGINPQRTRLLLIVAASLGTAAAVAVSGLIGFVGIIVPHTVRLLAGASYRVILPLSALFGAAFLTLADLAARLVLAPAEIPIGVVTAFFGAPFFVIVLRNASRST